jgi:hypothetical protein
MKANILQSNLTVCTDRDRRSRERNELQRALFETCRAWGSRRWGELRRSKLRVLGFAAAEVTDVMDQRKCAGDLGTADESSL